MPPIPILRQRSLPIAAMVGVVVVAWLLITAGQPRSVDGLCSDLAIVAAVVAALDRRTGAMLAAAALAATLSPQGLIIAPFAVGITIQRRATFRTIAAACTAAALGQACASIAPEVGTQSATLGLWALAEALPDGGRSATALLVAIGLGLTAWYVANLTARPRSGRALLETALLGLVGMIVLFPFALDAVVAPLAIGVATFDRRAFGRARSRAANDNPLRLRRRSPLPV